jgi:hypothetical protein
MRHLNIRHEFHCGRRFSGRAEIVTGRGSMLSVLPKQVRRPASLN